MRDYGDFVSEKVVDGDTYVAYRDPEHPRRCRIVKNGVTSVTTMNIKVDWVNPERLFH